MSIMGIAGELLSQRAYSRLNNYDDKDGYGKTQSTKVEA